MAHLQFPELTDQSGDLSLPARPTRQAAKGVGWAIAGAFAGATAWWVGGIAARYLFGAADFSGTTPAEWVLLTLILTGLGLGCGALVGSVCGLLRDHVNLKTVLVRVCWGAGIGAVGGGLPPMLTAATTGFLPPEASVILAGTVVGLLAGTLIFTWGREKVPPAGMLDEEAEEYAPPVVAARGGVDRFHWGPIGRVLPTALVSVACIVVVLVGSFSPVGWAILAVGLLGLGVVWALIGQERRIRELERKISHRR